MMTDIHNTPAEGNFCSEKGKAIKTQIVMDYKDHMGYVDKGDRMVNSYCTSRRILKWMIKFVFHLLDLTILNNYILHNSCGVRKCYIDIFDLPSREI